MTRPQDLTPTQYAALLFVINPSNWQRDRWGREKLNGAQLARHLGYKQAKSAYDILEKLIHLGYIDIHFKPTEQCDGMNKSLIMKGI